MQEPAAASYADGDWQAAFDAVGTGIMILDANLNVLRANCTLATWLGTSLEAMTCRPCCELIHKTDAPPEGCPAFYALRTHHEEHVEQEIPSMCGFYRCSAYPLIEDGAVKRLVVVINDVTERRRVDGELRLQTEYLAVLHETALGLIARRELPSLLTTIVERAAALLGAPHGFLYLLDLGAGEMELQVGLGAYAAHRGRRLRRGQGLAGHVWQTGRSLVAASDGDDLVRDAPGGSGRRSRVAVPLLAQGQVAGVLGVAAEVEMGGFHFDEIALLSRFAELASIAVDNGRLYEAVQRELAERRQAEESLRRSEGAFRLLFEQAPIGMAITDLEGRYLRVNEAHRKTLGYSPEELANMSFMDVTLPQDLPLNLDLRQKTLGGEIPGFRLEKRFLTRSGGLVYAILQVSLARDAQGNPLYFIGQVVDISEGKAAEEALRRSEARYRTLFESAGDAILIYDLNGRLLAANRLACDRLGYELEELLQMAPADLESPPYAGWFQERMEELRQHGHHFFETVHLRSDGTPIPTELSSRLIEYEGGLAVLAIARDVTERRQMEQRLLHTERLAAMGQLAAALAHEINNPLQSIGSSIELVLDYPLSPAEQQEYLEAVRQEVRRLMDVTGRVLDFARPPRSERQPVSAADVVRYALALTDKQLEQSRIDIHLDLPEGLPLVQASHGEVAQVFLNLIINAIEAMPDGGQLRIAARAAGNAVEIDFADTGAGLSAAALATLFQPFHTTKEYGTGLGLAVSYNIIQQQGGSIAAANAPAGGAVFTVSLPLAPAQEAI